MLLQCPARRLGAALDEDRIGIERFHRLPAVLARFPRPTACSLVGDILRRVRHFQLAVAKIHRCCRARAALIVALSLEHAARAYRESRLERKIAARAYGLDDTAAIAATEKADALFAFIIASVADAEDKDEATAQLEEGIETIHGVIAALELIGEAEAA